MQNTRFTAQPVAAQDGDEIRQEIKELQRRLSEAEVMHGIQESPHWQGYRQFFIAERNRLYAENQRLNLMIPEQLEQTIRNNGRLDILYALLESPREITEEAKRMGWRQRLERAMETLLKIQGGD